MDEKYIALTQEWHTKGWNARQGEIDELKAEIKKLRNLVGQAGCDIDAYQEGISELKTQLAVYKEDMQKDAEKIGELYAVLKCVSEHFEMNDLDGCMPRVFEMIQEALRGANA